jgi:serine/threonine protein kinase
VVTSTSTQAPPPSPQSQYLCVKQENIGDTYELEGDGNDKQLLGQGAYGYVVKGRRKHKGEIVGLDVEVAVKVVRTKYLITDEEKASIRREVEIHSKLKHKSIVPLLEVFETPKLKSPTQGRGAGAGFGNGQKLVAADEVAAIGMCNSGGVSGAAEEEVSALADQKVWLVMELCPHGTLGDLLSRYRQLVPVVAGKVIRQLFEALAYMHERGMMHGECYSMIDRWAASGSSITHCYKLLFRLPKLIPLALSIQAILSLRIY